MKKTNKRKLHADVIHGMGGHYEVQVMNCLEAAADGTPLRYEPAGPVLKQKNLIMPAGADFLTQRNWYIHLASYNYMRCKAGTGNTPNSEELDGTFSQTGTTVTRDTGTGEFTSGNVNDFIKFGSGESARIISQTNTLTVEVDREQTVAADTLTVYNTSRVTLDAFVTETSGRDRGASSNGFSEDFDTGVSTRFSTFNFATEASAKTYTEIGVGMAGSSTQLLSRIVLDSPVNVDIGQFLQVKFTLRLTCGRFRVSEAMAVDITGWPYPYTVTDITSNGTYWDVTLDKAHHYAVGRPITLSDVLPVKTNVSTITSTVSDFTVNATSHGRSPGDSIVIEGASPAGYDGTWTVATTPDSDSLTVTSGINLGAGTGGTVRLDTPATWYNGTHTIASIPSSDVVRITDANSIVQAGEGTCKNNLNAAGQIAGRAFNVSTNFGTATDGNRGSCDCNLGSQATLSLEVVTEANMATGIQFGVAKTVTASRTASRSSSYSVADRKYTHTFTFASDTGNSTSIRQFQMRSNVGTFFLTFEERQRKDDGFQLQVVIAESWDPELN